MLRYKSSHSLCYESMSRRSRVGKLAVMLLVCFLLWATHGCDDGPSLLVTLPRSFYRWLTRKTANERWAKFFRLQSEATELRHRRDVERNWRDEIWRHETRRDEVRRDEARWIKQSSFNIGLIHVNETRIFKTMLHEQFTTQLKFNMITHGEGWNIICTI